MDDSLPKPARYALTVEYDGSQFNGWQIQVGVSTVQETLEAALSRVANHPVRVTGAGRTDTGVHAEQMFAHFDTAQNIDTEQLSYKLNAFLPQDIAVKNIHPVLDTAHARFDATARSYRYFIHRHKNPFLNDFSWYLQKDLDLDLMNQAAKLLLQYEDFKSFSKTHTDVKTYLCDVKEAYWQQTDNQLIFNITADRFLRNMVRAVVGTLVEVGLHKLTRADFEQIIEARNRSKAGFSVPAKGLFLTKIMYPPKIFLPHGND